MMAAPASRTAGLYAAVVSIFFTLIAGVGLEQLGAATTERVVIDHRSGLAISGYDPVAYFTIGRAAMGRAEVETRFAGAAWRFINPGNRQAFIENPEVYMPVFGGYDPMGVARGVAVAGHPEVWLIAGDHLYLFRDRSTREAFEANPEQFLALARQQWPEVQNSLAQ
jgi:YHS domain-containing protein